MQCEQAQANHNNVMESAKGGFASPRAVSSLSYAETLAAEVDSKVDRIFAEADVNNDGAISHAEFLWVMTGLDFHLLEKLGVPAEGGYSAKETFLYNSKLNNSYDSAMEDWDRDIDQPFDSPKTGDSYGLNMYKSSSTLSMSNAGASIQGQLSFQNFGKGQGGVGRSISNDQGLGGASATGNGMTSREGSTKNRRLVVTRPINSPPPSGRRAESGLLDTHLEQPAGGNSSSGGPSEEIPNERPVQRQSRRQRDVQIMERVETPPSYKGILAQNAASNDFYEEPQVCF